MDIREFVSNEYNKVLTKYPPEFHNFACAFSDIVNALTLEYKEGDPFCARYSFPKRKTIYNNPRPKLKYHEDEEISDLVYKFREDYLTWGEYTSAHTCLDYETILKKGLIYYYEKICLLNPKDIDNLNHSDIDNHDTMRFALFANTYLAKNYLKCVPNKKENKNLIKALNTVPDKPAYDFLSAIQSVWIMHTLIPIAENSFASISLGRFDQYMYPYYLKDKKKGYSDEYFINMIVFMLQELQKYHDGACALNIGGLNKNGEDATNELSLLIIEAEKRVLGASPIVAVRISEKTSDEFIKKLIDKDLFSIGQPTFYSEENCMKSLEYRGTKKNDIKKFVANSCMGLMIPGKEIADMWGCVLNTHLPLELAVNMGKPLHGEIPFELTTTPKEITCIEDLILQYSLYLTEILELAIEMYNVSRNYSGVYNQDPLLSALTDGCREKGTDRTQEDSTYFSVTVEAMAFANTANAMAIINQKCLNEKAFTVAELVKSAKHDFTDNRGIDILPQVKEVSLYGENNGNLDQINKPSDIFCNDIKHFTSDDFAAIIVECLSNSCKKHSTKNVFYVPSLHTLDANVGYGINLYTTLDGRIKGEPVNKNAGPTNKARNAGHTSIIQSAAHIEQFKFSGGQPIDLYFPQNMFSESGKEKILTLIKTYFKLGGLQIQVNSANIELLEKAHKEPDKYPDVIVRLGGFSSKFINLSPEVRKEHIARMRTEQESQL